jgi:hypothetical protein
VSNTAGNYIGAASASDVNYSWTASSGTLPTGPNPLVNPSVTTTYTLTATKFYSSCSASNAVTVTVNTTVPVANAGSPFTKTCASNVNGNTIGAPAITGESYNWTASAGSAVPAAISNPTVNPSVTTTYEVTAKNNLSLCTSKAQVLVKVDTVAPPTPNLIKNSIPNECPRVTVNLNSLVTNTTNLKWYKESARINEVTNPTAVSVSGLYYAFYLDSANGCFSNSTTAVANAVITVPCCRALFAPDLTN